MDSFKVFSSLEREQAHACANDGALVVYNLGHAIREVDEEGHTVPIGHFGCLPESNSIVEGLIDGGFLNLIGGEPAPKKKAAPKKKSSSKADGYNPDAKDGDGDGLVQDGTQWERAVE
jgi:hypothetical protein